MSFLWPSVLPGMGDVMKRKEIFTISFHYVTEMWRNDLTVLDGKAVCVCECDC